VLASASQPLGIKPGLYRRNIPSASTRRIDRFGDDKVLAALNFEPNANGHRDE
jgi:hypothetical protein